MTDVACQTAEVKPMSRITQMMAKQILGQSLRDSVKDDFGARGAVHQHRINPTQMKGSELARLQPAGMSFMQADPVEWTNSNNRFVGDALDFNQDIVAGTVTDDLAPEQAPLKPFEQADLLNDCGRGQMVFQNGLELIAGEDGRKIENVLNRKPVPFAVGNNLQAHSFSKKNHDLLSVPLGKLASKGRFNFLDDFGGGKGVPAG